MVSGLRNVRGRWKYSGDDDDDDGDEGDDEDGEVKFN